jgi:hypothetical protein
MTRMLESCGFSPKQVHQSVFDYTLKLRISIVFNTACLRAYSTLAFVLCSRFVHAVW